MKRLLLYIFILMLAISACAPRVESYAATQPGLLPRTPTPAAERVSSTPTRSLGCTAVTQKTPNPTVESLLPPPTEKDHIRGPKDAVATIIEYSDFMCPSCAAIEPVLAQLESKYPQDLRVVFRHFPLSSHDKAQLSARAAEAAGLQGKFWEMHDLLYEQQKNWTNLSLEEFTPWVTDQATALGLDKDRFVKDMNSEAVVKLVKNAWDQNAAIGMPGTPFLVVDGEPYNGPLDFANLDATISLITLERRQFSECPPMTIDPNKHYIATIKTDKGDIVVELFADKAPMAVNNFIFLARKGWYDGVTFHRVIPGFVAQAGDPTGTGFGGPGYAFDIEVSPNLVFDRPGILGMANSGPGSNGSQFFITMAATPHLNGGYTIFGDVLSGLDVLQKLTPRDPSQSMDLPPGDRITTITIEEK
jgi:cyclophilin family peptidyl-prolyl cis-trans isomerase/protein-disulfide isomerase